MCMCAFHNTSTSEICAMCMNLRLSERCLLPQGVIVMSGARAAEDGLWEAVKETLSDTTDRWDAATLAEWMEESRVLIVIDDFIMKFCREALEEALEEWTEASFMLMTRPEDAAAARTLLAEHQPALILTLPGLSADAVHVLAARFLPQQEQEPFRMWVEARRGLLAEVLTYPALVEPACRAWQTGKWSVATQTTTELIWGIVEHMMSVDKRWKVSSLTEWLLAIGRLARASLEKNGLPNLKEDFEKEAVRLFSRDFAQGVFSAFCFSQSSTMPATVTLPHPLTQFLAAWDAIHENLHGTPMKALVKRITDEDSIVIYAAGHLARLLEHQPDLPEKNVSRAAKNLVLHMDRAKDRFGYTLRVIHECRTHPRVIKTMAAEVEIARYWEVRNNAVFPDAVSALLQHTVPSKIQVTVEKNMVAPDIMGVVELVAKTNYPVFLAEMNHLEWEHPDTTDELVHVLQAGTAPLEDFLGCMNVATIESLALNDVTRHLVCLRVRVCDVTAVKALLQTPSCLPNLMWLEADFDLCLYDITTDHLTRVPTLHMDVCFKDLADKDVDYMCDLLSFMRPRYSGVHVTRCSLTPQGVANILKNFYKRGMFMTATDEAIKRYRRWRFPALSNIAGEVTDAAAHHLLGYEDRYHYSDNEVRSSAVLQPADAKFLSNFFVAMEDLLFFRYVSANYTVLKKCGGTVEITRLA